MHLGKNICCVRELLKIKQQTLADALKVSQQTISKIEQTEKLSDSVVERIATALGVEAGVILNYDETKIVNCIRVADAIDYFYARLQNQMGLLKTAIDLYETLLTAEKDRVILQRSTEVNQDVND